MSILWVTDPLSLQDKLPLKIPDYDAWLERRLQKRLQCDKPGSAGEESRRAEYVLCKHDILHWLKYWGWLYNPQRQNEDEQVFPFIPYVYQEEYILYLQDAIRRCNDGNTFERENIVDEKCRDMAATWSTLAVLVHDFIFYNGSYLILSWREEDVDTAGNLGTPFEKMRFMLRRIPDWQKPPEWDWDKHSMVGILKNPKGGSIVGSATTSAVGAGDRRKAVIFDEFAKVGQKRPGLDDQMWRSAYGTARLRVAISTPEGPNNKFARLVSGEEQEAIKLISFNWWKDPIKAQGLEFINGKPSSPWYREQERTLDPQTLASQVNINYQKSQKGGIYDELYGPHHRRRTWTPDDTTRIESQCLKPIEGHRLIVAIDPGTHWFALWTQIDSHGRYYLLNEMYHENADIDKIGENILQINRELFPGFDVEYCGDPAGGNVNSSLGKGKSEYMYLFEHFGIMVCTTFMPKDQSDWENARIRSVQHKLNRLDKQGPLMLVDVERCPLADRALNGGYRWKTDVSGLKCLTQTERTHPMADAADCIGYPLLYKGMMPHNPFESRKARTREVNWRSPSEMKYR